MSAYIIRRLLQTLPVLFLFSVIVFAVLRMVPGDPAVVMLGLQATPEAVAEIRQEMGLDRSIPVQYVVWVDHVFHGDFGISWTSKQPVWKLIQRRFEATILLTFGAGGANVIRTHHINHAGADEARQRRGQSDAKGDGGQNEVLDRLHRIFPEGDVPRWRQPMHPYGKEEQQ
jgi:hypothetical protein